jgi:hypothetical protein
MTAEKLSTALKEHSRSLCIPVIINAPAGHATSAFLARSSSFSLSTNATA